MQTFAIRSGAIMLLFLAIPARLGSQPNAKLYPETPESRVVEIPFSQVLQLSASFASIGSEDEDGPYMFGSINGLAVGPGGEIYVNDWSENTIRSFRRDGRFVASFGRRGRGPGEFVNPLFLVLDGDSTLYAAEMNFGITELGVSRGAMTLRSTFGLELKARTLCLMRDSVVVSGWKDEKQFHVLGSDRGVVRAFGVGWGLDTFPLVREQMNRAHTTLLCDSEAGRIVAAQGAGPVVRSYRWDGALEWEITLPSYRYTQTVIQGSGFALGGGGDGTGFIGKLPGDRVMIQVTRIDMTKARATSRGPGGRITVPQVGIRTFILNARTGEILSVSTDAPSFAAMQGELVVQAQFEPFPQILLRRITGRN